MENFQACCKRFTCPKGGVNGLKNCIAASPCKVMATKNKCFSWLCQASLPRSHHFRLSCAFCYFSSGFFWQEQTFCTTILGDFMKNSPSKEMQWEFKISFKVGIGVGAVSCSGILPSIVFSGWVPQLSPCFSWLNAATPKRLQAARPGIEMDWRNSATQNKFPKANSQEVTFRLILACTPNVRPKRVNSTDQTRPFVKFFFQLKLHRTSWDVVPTSQTSTDFNDHALSCPSRLQGTYLFSRQAPRHVASTWSKSLAWGMTRPPHYRSAPFRNHSLLTLQNLLVGGSWQKKNHQSFLIEIFSGCRSKRLKARPAMVSACRCK